MADTTVRAKMTWAGGLKFDGINVWGNKISTDGSKAAGGQEEGIKPTEMLLYGMAGCAGIDVVRIMKKQRQELTDLDIEIIAYQQEEYPKPFHTIEMKFSARGKNIDRKKLEKAIELSEAKYCVVSQTIQNITKVTTSAEIVED